MLYYLHYLAISDPEHLSFLRLFKYVTFRAGGAAFTAFLIAVLFGGWTVRKLKQFGAVHQPRPEDMKPVAAAGVGGGLSATALSTSAVPQTALSSNVVPGEVAKERTPIMGGLLIIGAIFLSMILWANPTSALGIVFLLTLLAMGAIGFVDDYIKVTSAGPDGKPTRDGLPGRAKLIMQILIAVGAVWLLDVAQSPPWAAQVLIDGSLPGEVAHVAPSSVRMLMVPFLKEPLVENLPLWVAIGFGALVVVGSSNAVNLSDGMDGLAIGCTIISALTYAIFAYVCGHREFAEYLRVPYVPGSSEVVVIGTAMAGAGLGFLWHNCHPASMFMGDTGSLSLGGAIGLIAVLVKQELLLVVVGGVFVIEAGSVILQVSYYKLTRKLTGEPKRLFKCAPIHIHFRRSGFHETQIVVRFWIVALILAAIGIATLKVR